MTPGKRLAWALAAGLPLFALGRVGVGFGVALDALLLLCAWLEARQLRQRVPSVTRRVAERWLIGVDNVVTIALHNPSAWRLSGTLRDSAPSALVLEPAELRFVLPPGAATELSYVVRVARRGVYELGPLAFRLDGPLGLGSSIQLTAAPASVRVYPRVPALQHGPMRGSRVLRGSGLRSARAHGGAGEFEQLREYVPGDALRDLDWKATAKRSHPITRVHGLEQSQSVLIALDVGRLMALPLGDSSRLDHALAAALLLAQVALRAGDRVGMVVFAQGVQRVVLPARGRSQYARLLANVFDVEASDAPADFSVLAGFLASRVRRRSLVLIFSELGDEAQLTPGTSELPKLAARHLLACVTLSCPDATRVAEAPARDNEQAYARAAAIDWLSERASLHARLARAGIAVLEATAADVAVRVVNRYLEIKRRQRL